MPKKNKIILCFWSNMIYMQASSKLNNASWDTMSMNLCTDVFSNHKMDDLEY